MGCFNRTGFLSHLPIQHKDEIVVFVLIKEDNKYKMSSIPIGICDELRPLNAPIFGKYDEYGGIEDVVDDANHKLFRKMFGMPIDKFLRFQEYFGISVQELDALNAEIEKDELTAEEKSDSEILLEVYHRLFANCADMGKLTFSYTMELKSVYDKMVETGRESYFNGYWDSKKTSVDESFDNTAEIIKLLTDNLGNDFKGVNPLTIGYDDTLVNLLDKTKISDFDLKTISPYRLLTIKVALYDHLFYYDSDYAMYNNLKGDISELKECLVNFAYFLKSMKDMDVIFAVSPYHKQTVAYDTLIPIYEKMVEILKNHKR